jgi:hypothetical protein
VLAFDKLRSATLDLLAVKNALGKIKPALPLGFDADMHRWRQPKPWTNTLSIWNDNIRKACKDCKDRGLPKDIADAIRNIKTKVTTLMPPPACIGEPGIQPSGDEFKVALIGVGIWRGIAWLFGAGGGTCAAASGAAEGAAAEAPSIIETIGQIALKKAG